MNLNQLSPKYLAVTKKIWRDIEDNQLMLYSTSLVYTTLLSIVPMLAVVFSALKAFNVHNMMVPMLLEVLKPLGEKRVEILEHLVQFVENTQVTVLGSVGFVFLIYTTISLIQKIEKALNLVWHIKTMRPLSQRIGNYLSVVLLGPALVFTAIGVATSLTQSDFAASVFEYKIINLLFDLASFLLPSFLITMAFSLVYFVIPNTRVTPVAALAGGLFAAVLWQALGGIFTAVVASSAKYTAIYSAFASLIIFMMWLYLGWLIILVGAKISYYWQNRRSMVYENEFPVQNIYSLEMVILQILSLITKNFYATKAPLSEDSLFKKLQLPREVIRCVLDRLVQSGILFTDEAENPVYLPARPFEVTPLSDALQAVVSLRTNEEIEHNEDISAGNFFMQRISVAINESVSGFTIKSLIDKNVTVNENQNEIVNRDDMVNRDETPTKIKKVED